MHSSGLLKIKHCPTTSILPHVNKLIPAQDPNAHSLDSERLECARSNQSGCFRTHEILLWVS